MYLVPDVFLHDHDNDVLAVVAQGVLLFLFGLSRTECQMYLCFAVHCEEVTSVWVFHTPSRKYPNPMQKMC